MSFKVSFPKTGLAGIGVVPAFEVTVPENVAGRLDIYYTSNNKQIWCNLDPQGSINSYVEPGCLAFEKFLIGQVRFSGPASEGEEGAQAPIVELAAKGLNISVVEA